MKPFFKDMTVTREFANRSTVETYLLGAAGGSSRSHPAGTFLKTHHRTVWEKETLVIESGMHTGSAPETGDWTEHREVWSLDSGRLHVEISDKSSSGPPFAATLVYKRKPQTIQKQ